ncbi:MAG: tetratricopeptide repeat protein [Betaproteobacteria bacterium]
MPDSFEQARSFFLLGVDAFEAGRFAEAEEKFRASLALLPGRASTLANLGATLQKRGQSVAALQVLDQALAADPGNVDALGHRGVALGEAGRYNEALACHDKLLAADAEHVAAWYQRGMMLNVLDRHDEALHAFDQVLRIDPRHGSGWLCRGQTLQSAGREAEALPCYDKAIALEPGLSLAWTHRAILLKDLKRLDEAALAFEAAIAHGGDPELNGYFLSSLRGGAAPAAPPKHFIESLFDDYADNFEEHMVDVLKYRAHRVLAENVAGVAGTAFGSVLDLGCGSGLCGALLAPVAARITGVDVSANMLEKAVARGVYAEVVQRDIVEFLQTTNERFDLIIAADVFIYVGDLQRVFDGVRQVAEPGAVFCFSVELPDQPQGFELRPSLRYAHSEAYVLQLAATHGFEVAKLLCQPIREDQQQPIPGLYVYLISR